MVGGVGGEGWVLWYDGACPLVHIVRGAWEGTKETRSCVLIGGCIGSATAAILVVNINAAVYV